MVRTRTKTRATTLSIMPISGSLYWAACRRDHR